jgi:hypothetical protein
MTLQDGTLGTQKASEWTLLGQTYMMENIMFSRKP